MLFIAAAQLGASPIEIHTATASLRPIIIHRGLPVNERRVFDRVSRHVSISSSVISTLSFALITTNKFR